MIPSQPDSTRRWLLAAPLAVFAVLAAGFYVALQGGGPNRVPSTLIGRPAPAIALPPLAGLDNPAAMPGLDAAALRTGQPIIVNVWASWCGPCREEQPILAVLANQAKVQLYGINYKDTPEGARAFLAKFGNPFSRIGTDSTGRASIEWGVYGVPETYVVDGRGIVTYKHIGPITARDIETVLLPAIARARASR